MQISMSRASLPVFVRYLGNLSEFIGKAAAYAEKHKVDPRALLDARLFPDMHPLTSQVQFACDFAKGAAYRLAGLPVPSFKDDESTFDDLQARIAKTLEAIGAVKPEQIDGSEDRDIAFNFGGTPLRFRGDEYLTGFALPSMIFHVTVAYAILRHNGIPLGKTDFLGKLS